MWDSLARTFESLRSDTLLAAASQVAKAPKVWLLGLGLDDGLVRFVRPQLARIRPEVYCMGSQHKPGTPILSACWRTPRPRWWKPWP